MLNTYRRLQIAKEDIKRLRQTVKRIPKEASISKFSEHMCLTCPFMCNNCNFCFMLFKHNTLENYERILEKLIFSFYLGVDVSNLSYLIYSICPICKTTCKDIYTNNCSCDYIKQFGRHTPMFKYSFGPPKNLTTVSYNHKKNILVKKRHSNLRIFSNKPCLIITGQTMSKIVNKIWRLNENTSQTWANAS